MWFLYMRINVVTDCFIEISDWCLLANNLCYVDDANGIGITLGRLFEDIRHAACAAMTCELSDAMGK